MKNILNPFAVLILVAAPFITVLAQKGRPDIEFGNVKVPDFSPKLYPVDSSAGTVYLFDVGSSHYESDKSRTFSVVYERHARIRLLKKASFDDVATIKFNLYQRDFWHQQTVEKIVATTYNLERGHVVATELDKKSTFEDKAVGDIVAEIVREPLRILKIGDIELIKSKTRL